MAGHGYVKHDPAIERWNRMREDVYKYFKFTRRATWFSLAGCVFVPAAIALASQQTDLRWSWPGKRKGESLSN
ncbi:hypothetical protein EWM64_g1045 [Hericium alpestre]|uniref:Complex I-B15 n=1 Tax=Hericium alpestre TaxID=135208 RepID=A0A4Z0A9I5_9AGAM|nr:hypothetical protein EWM64_g1045 [Hericium alpestre]